MAKNTTQLPDDVAALKALLIDRGSTIEKQLETIAQQGETIARQGEAIARQGEAIVTLEHNVEVYRRMAFGSPSERRPKADAEPLHPHQAHLFARDLLAEAERVSREKQVEGSIETATPTKPKTKGGGGKRFPEHLPRVKSRYQLPEDQRRCICGGEMHEIGVELTRELERLETAIIHEIERAKYACRKCGDGVRTAPGPDRVIDKGLLGPGFLAQVAVDRFGDHMPYHRLEKKYAREGLNLGRSVLERSMAKCAELLEPIWQAMGEQVLASAAIYTDDTPVTIARGSSGKSRKGRMWIYLDQEERYFYDFTESRKRDGPMAVLSDYEGFIHADAYPGYDALFLPDGATEVACWAHTRRKFIDAEKTDPELAAGAIELIGRLYGVERQAKEHGLNVEQRAVLRQSESVPVLEQLRAYLAGAEAKVLPKSPMARAVGYAQAQWAALCVYTTDGRLDIDNNAAERAMKPVAVGRNSWLFVQNVKGGKRAAIFLSLVMTAKSIGVDPVMYLRDVLLRIARETDVTKLTPHGWKKHFAGNVAAGREAAVARLLER